MFETLMSTIKAKVVSAEFRCATAARMQAMFNAMAKAQTNQSEFDSAADEEQPIEVESASAPAAVPQPAAPQPAAASASGKTIGDVFASMMNQNRAAAGVRPVTVVPAGPRPGQVPAVGRNDLCPCGSGKKYKKCCGRGLA